MKLKCGPDLQVLGEVVVDNKKHFICKALHPFYTNGIFVSLVVMPASEFEFNDGSPWCEVINESVDKRKVSENDRASTESVQTDTSA